MKRLCRLPAELVIIMDRIVKRFTSMSGGNNHKSLFSTVSQMGC